VCSAVREGIVCNSCATCISHTISHGTTQPSIHLRLVQEIRAERVHLQKKKSPDRPSVSDATVDGELSFRHLPYDSRRVPVRCVHNFEGFSIDCCGCEVLSKPHLFSVSF
jgi:hypothetical protein